MDMEKRGTETRAKDFYLDLNLMVIFKSKDTPKQNNPQ